MSTHKHPGACPGGNCRLCWLADNDPRYQRLWGLPVTGGSARPGLATMAGTFVKAAAGHVMNGLRTVDDETYLERVKACEVCDFFQENRCTKCGCRLGTKGVLDKARWRSEDCPMCSACGKTAREGCRCDPFVSLWGPRQ